MLTSPRCAPTLSALSTSQVVLRQPAPRFPAVGVVSPRSVALASPCAVFVLLAAADWRRRPQHGWATFRRLRLERRAAARAATSGTNAGRRPVVAKQDPDSAANSSGDDGNVDEMLASLPYEALVGLSGVDRTLWPMLLLASAAEAKAGWSADLGSSVVRAANGLASWREALVAGHVWEDADGADWPADKNLRHQWAQTLGELDMPRFTEKYPQLMRPLFTSLLETVPRFEALRSQESSDGADAPEQAGSTQEPSAGDASGASASGDGQVDAQTEQPRDLDVNDLDSEVAAESLDDDGEAGSDVDSRAAEVMNSLREEWKGAVDSLKEAEAALGGGAGAMVADGISSGKGDEIWRETEAWKEVAACRAVLKRSPALRELIRELGRRSATRGPKRRLPEEIPRAGLPMGVARSELAQTETSGICRSGDPSRMVPGEAQLLAAQRPVLRSLFHARRIERSLLSYDRRAWLEEEAVRTRQTELRPMGKAGPLIICLDTSGSMQGMRETVGKSVVLEGMRQAHREKRRCYLYAFSGQGQLQELELDLSPSGLRALLEFLKSSFSGGTSLDPVLEASARRLGVDDDDWRNADLLIVTDGEVPMPRADAVASLEAARHSEGARVVGVVLGECGGQAMEQLCDELYITGSPPSRRTPWSRPGQGMTASTRGPWPCLRKVQERRASIAPKRPVSVPAATQTRRRQAYAFVPFVGAAQPRNLSRQVRAAGFRLRCLAAARSPPLARRSPDFSRFSESLVLVVQEAEREARRLSQGTLGTNSLLQGLLAAPAAAKFREVVFPDVAAAASAARAIVEVRVAGADDGDDPGGQKPGGPLRFTPMAERALLEAEQEQMRLNHKTVEPAHLLLALMRDPRGDACEMMRTLRQDLGDVRLKVLASLDGPLAAVKLRAAQRLESMRASCDVQPNRKARSEKQPLASVLMEALDVIENGLVERSVEAKLLLLAAVSGEHLFLLGPPGTAKSLLARRLSLVSGGLFFEHLLTRFTVPEEVFGPLSLKALENDQLLRKTEGYLPEADVAFLDEIFKANSSILNALLTVLNERVFDNGGNRKAVPLWCAVAASNELPESDDLDALFDRFLLRRAVPPVSDASVPIFLQAVLDGEPVLPLGSSSSSSTDRPLSKVVKAPLLSATVAADAQKGASESVEFPDRLLRLVARLRAYLRDEADPPVVVSDRRLAKAVRLVRVATHVAGGRTVSVLDLLLLQHMFWDREPGQATEVKEWILDQYAPSRFISRGNARDISGITKEDDFLPQTRHIFGLLCGRLRMGSNNPTVCSTVLRDLRAARDALEEQVRSLREEARNLRAALCGGNNGLRTFWLEPADVKRASDLLLPRLTKATKEAHQLLLQVEELVGALELQSTKDRHACVTALLADTDAGRSPSLDERGEGLEDLNRWAATLQPDGLPDVLGIA